MTVFVEVFAQFATIVTFFALIFYADAAWHRRQRRRHPMSPADMRERDRWRAQ